jgi:hypothetical protein
MSALQLQLSKERWWRGPTCAFSIVATVASIVAVIVGGIAISKANRLHSTAIYTTTSATLTSQEENHFLDASAAPMALLLPADMTDYVGGVYRVYSRTAQAHTVTIALGGATYYGGSARVATFGGAIGDGFEFLVLSPTIVQVTDVRNVIFS